MGFDDLLVEWGGYLPQLVAILRGDQPLPAGSMPAHDWVIVSDIGAHDQDLRGALDASGDRESMAVALGLGRYVTGSGRGSTARACRRYRCVRRTASTSPVVDRFWCSSPPAGGAVQAVEGHR
jgi:hypothetical protein